MSRGKRSNASDYLTPETLTVPVKFPSIQSVPQFLIGSSSSNNPNEQTRSAGGGSSSGEPGCEHNASAPVDAEHDERAKLLRKMEQVKQKLRGVAMMQENEVEEFCKMTRQLGAGTGAGGVTGSGVGSDNNPQMARIRQHFEKRNKKHTQETNQLREKLAQCQTRLDELDAAAEGLAGNGSLADGDAQHRFASTALGGLSSMMAMPRDLASRLRKQFGSADNIHGQLSDRSGPDEGPPSSARSPAGRKAQPSGRTTFYTHDGEPAEAGVPHTLAASTTGAGFSPGHRRGKSDLAPIVNDPQPAGGKQRAQHAASVEMKAHKVEPHRDLDETGSAPHPPEPTQRSMDDLRKQAQPSGEAMQAILDELQEMRRKFESLEDSIEQLSARFQSESGYFHSSLHEERFRCQRLEEQLNDMMELQQAESAALRNEMQHVAGRLEYQRVEAMRDLNEMFESTQNRLAVVEQKCESISRGETGLRVSGASHELGLRVANVAVELIKLLMYLSSVLLDAFKPIAGGSRNRSAALLGVFLLLLVFGQLFGGWRSIWHMFIHARANKQ